MGVGFVLGGTGMMGNAKVDADKNWCVEWRHTVGGRNWVKLECGRRPESMKPPGWMRCKNGIAVKGEVAIGRWEREAVEVCELFVVVGIRKATRGKTLNLCSGKSTTMVIDENKIGKWGDLIFCCFWGFDRGGHKVGGEVKRWGGVAWGKSRHRRKARLAVVRVEQVGVVAKVCGGTCTQKWVPVSVFGDREIVFYLLIEGLCFNVLSKKKFI